MNALILLILTIINLYIFVVIVGVILSWLIAFNILNLSNQFVQIVMRFLTAVTEPVLRPIRSVIPDLGGVDLSPLILILLLYFVKNLILEYGVGLG